MAVTTRTSTPDDEDLLFRLFAENKAREFALLGMGEEQLRLMVTMQYRLRCASYAADFPDSVQQIVEQDGNAVGQVLLNEEPDALYVVDIAIAGTHRGSGVGTAAFRSLCDRAAAERKSIRLRVIPQSDAFRLYRRLGFVTVSGDATGEEMVWQPCANAG